MDLPSRDAVVLQSAEDAHRFYSQQHRKYLGQVQGFAAGSEQGCFRRYWAACHVGDMNGASLLDVGCGYGGLVPFAVGAGVRQYVGIDVVPEFIAEARGRWGCIGDRVQIRFEEKSITDGLGPFADYVVMLGTGGYGTPEYVSDLLRVGMSCARKGMVFSLCRDFMTLGEFMDRCFAVTSHVIVRCDVWMPDYVAYLYPDE